MTATPPYPQFLYKYRPDNAHSIDALFGYKAIFSNRNGFNDPFDARLKISELTISQLERVDLANRISPLPVNLKLPRLTKNGTITAVGRVFLRSFYARIERKIDSYQFLCLSATATSPQMWAHYANSQSGFCIEFKSTHTNGDKIIYDDREPNFSLTDFLINERDTKIGMEIWAGLRTKQSAWSYEDEYRIQPSSEMEKRLIAINENTSYSTYEPHWVESIIFGLRMPVERRFYIMKNYPNTVKFKEVIISGSCLSIIDLRKTS